MCPKRTVWFQTRCLLRRAQAMKRTFFPNRTSHVAVMQVFHMANNGPVLDALSMKHTAPVMRRYRPLRPQPCSVSLLSVSVCVCLSFSQSLTRSLSMQGQQEYLCVCVCMAQCKVTSEGLLSTVPFVEEASFSMQAILILHAIFIACFNTSMCLVHCTRTVFEWHTSSLNDLDKYQNR